ncbi:uncharacterized protein LOC133879414 isoform X2 [Alnus glutinosa]|uniref:uncharacterized protein LOC133879414 isoform X2 n=1 Tax=Alnus glutinosa TaxID=3517 RepID=UPI002D7862C3|nr:uncharacterized protein LOC133879414 isoform X2 [Alnus glutinosa]
MPRVRERPRDRERGSRRGEENRRAHDPGEADPPWMDAGDSSSGRCYRWVDSSRNQELGPVIVRPIAQTEPRERSGGFHWRFLARFFGGFDGRTNSGEIFGKSSTPMLTASSVLPHGYIVF